MSPEQVPDVWGIADICEAVDVTRKTVSGWRDRADFPPAAKVNRGKTAVWDRVQVLHWIEVNSGVERIRAIARELLA